MRHPRFPQLQRTGQRSGYCSGAFHCNVGIGSFFVGALAYADDIVLLAPTASAMRKMLKICEEYAGNLSVIFNASKSKCVVCQSRQRVKTTGINSSIQFAINSSIIEVVNSWPHLGHVRVLKRSEKEGSLGEV